MAKPYKRGEIWWGRVTYRGKEYRSSLETTSYRIAQERFLTFIAEVKSGKWGDGRRYKFNHAIEKFINDHFPSIRPNSRKRYAVSLMNLQDHLPVMFLDEIDSASLNRFEVSRRKQGVTNGTIRRDLMCLSSLMSSAVIWKWCSQNPVSEYLRAARKRGMIEAPPRDRFLSHAEETRLFEYIKTKRGSVKGDRDIHGWQMQEAVFAFAIDTGLRAEEIFSLTWPQVYLNAREVVVTKEMAKGKRGRTVPILERSLRLLAALPRSEHSNFVFWHGDGKRYRHMYVQLMRICGKVGIENIEFHDLRRTTGIRLLRDHHFGLERVSLWLGHNNINITEKVYAFLSFDELHKAVADSPLIKANGAQKSAHHENGW